MLEPAQHRTIVVVDIEAFGDPTRTDRDRLAVRRGMYRALRRAVKASGISWRRCHVEDRGDGILLLAPPDLPKAPFAATLPGALAAALAEHNAAHGEPQQIRLRMALHAGEVFHDPEGVVASAVNLAFRLLDAPPLKDELADAPGVLALAASEWFYQEVIRHAEAADTATYRSVGVNVKETSVRAWIARPAPSAPSGRSARRFGMAARAWSYLVVAAVVAVVIVVVTDIWASAPPRSAGTLAIPFNLCSTAGSRLCATRVPHTDNGMIMFPLDKAWRWDMAVIGTVRASPGWPFPASSGLDARYAGDRVVVLRFNDDQQRCLTDQGNGNQDSLLSCQSGSITAGAGAVPDYFVIAGPSFVSVTATVQLGGTARNGTVSLLTARGTDLEDQVSRQLASQDSGSPSEGQGWRCWPTQTSSQDC